MHEFTWRMNERTSDPPCNLTSHLYSKASSVNLFNKRKFKSTNWMSKLTKKTLTKRVTVYSMSYQYHRKAIPSGDKSSYLKVIEEERQITTNSKNHCVSF